MSMFQNNFRAPATVDPHSTQSVQLVDTLPSVYHQHTTFKAKAKQHYDVLQDVHSSVVAMQNADIVWNGNKFRVLDQDQSKCCDVVGEVYIHPSDSTFMVECYRRAGCASLFNRFYSNLRGKCAVAEQSTPSSFEAPTLCLNDSLVSVNDVLDHQRRNLQRLVSRVDKGCFSVDDVDALTLALAEVPYPDVIEALCPESCARLLALPAKIVNDECNDDLACVPATKLAVAIAALNVLPPSSIVTVASTLAQSICAIIRDTPADNLSLPARELLRQLAIVQAQATRRAGFVEELEYGRTFLAKYASNLLQWARSQACADALAELRLA